MLPWIPPCLDERQWQFYWREVLKPEYYGVYAQYFVKYIQEMKKNGITIDALPFKMNRYTQAII